MNCVEFDEIHKLFSPELQWDVEDMMNATGLDYYECWYDAIACGLKALYCIPEANTYGGIYECFMHYINDTSDIWDPEDVDHYYDWVYDAGVDSICGYEVEKPYF